MKHLPEHVVNAVEYDRMAERLILHVAHLLASVPLHDKVLQTV